MKKMNLVGEYKDLEEVIKTNCAQSWRTFIYQF